MDDTKFNPEYSMSNFDINNWMDKYYKNKQVPYIGTFSRNTIPNTKTSFATIVNLDEQGNPGTHWVCTYNDKKAKHIIYFDSYGLPPISELMEKFRPNDSRGILYNTGILQPGNALCGWLSCLILRELSLGKSFREILLQFDPIPSEKNIQIVEKYFKP